MSIEIINELTRLRRQYDELNRESEVLLRRLISDRGKLHFKHMHPDEVVRATEMFYRMMFNSEAKNTDREEIQNTERHDA